MIVLASASPRRRELLASAGIACVVRPSQADESPLPGEPPRAYALRVAMEKAFAVDDKVGEASVPVLSADTTVAFGKTILGKPESAENALATLRLLSGATHHVHTAVVVRLGSRVHRQLVSTSVEFRPLQEREIARYVASGEPLDRAGAYAIQGGAGAFVHRIRGSYTGVVGLPLGEALALLARVGIRPEG